MRFADGTGIYSVIQTITRNEWFLFAQEAGWQHTPYMDSMTDDERLTILESSPTARSQYGLVEDRD
jgi:hypothetical protein